MGATRTVDVPEQIDVSIDGRTVTVSGDDAVLEREFDHPAVSVGQDDGSVTVTTDSDKRDDEAVVGTYASLIENMFTGVTTGYEYKMEGFYAHFPMDMSVEGDTFVIKNFIGERAPREIAIPDGVSIEVDGEDVIVRGADKEEVGQTAANIEQACYKGSRDPRKFQDGIYITEKGVTSDE